MNFPDVSAEKAILNFMKFHKTYNGIINEDNFNLESARISYYKMDKEFNDMIKG